MRLEPRGGALTAVEHGEIDEHLRPRHPLGLAHLLLPDGIPLLRESRPETVLRPPSRLFPIQRSSEWLGRCRSELLEGSWRQWHTWWVEGPRQGGCPPGRCDITFSGRPILSLTLFDPSILLMSAPIFDSPRWKAPSPGLGALPPLLQCTIRLVLRIPRIRPRTKTLILLSDIVLMLFVSMRLLVPCLARIRSKNRCGWIGRGAHS